MIEKGQKHTKQAVMLWSHYLMDATKMQFETLGKGGQIIIILVAVIHIRSEKENNLRKWSQYFIFSFSMFKYNARHGDMEHHLLH